MEILIGTKNKGKIEGAKIAFEKYFKNVNIVGIKVDSEVNDQPFNDEVIEGSKNRIKNLKLYAKENNLNPDFYISSEAGIFSFNGNFININVGIIENKNGLQSIGTSQGFPIPKKYIDEIKKTDLGTVMDNIFESSNLSVGKGGISILTHNETSRIDLTTNAFIMALTSQINDNIW